MDIFKKIKEFCLIFFLSTVLFYIVIYSAYLLGAVNELKGIYGIIMLLTVVQFMSIFMGLGFMLVLVFLFALLYFIFQLKSAKMRYLCICLWTILWYMYGGYLVSINAI